MSPRQVRISSFLAIAALAAVQACDKSANDASAPSSAKEPTSASAAPVVSSSASAPVVASAAPAMTVASVDAGKAKGGGVALKQASKRVEGKNFSLEFASAGCKAAAECTMTIKTVALGSYHVNKEYPYKFSATGAPGLEFLAKGTPNTFTRDAGDFVEQGEKTGTMTVRFKAASPGETHLVGTFKFSVCSADQCQIEQEKIDLPVPVS